MTSLGAVRRRDGYFAFGFFIEDDQHKIAALVFAQWIAQRPDPHGDAMRLVALFQRNGRHIHIFAVLHGAKQRGAQFQTQRRMHHRQQIDRNFAARKTQKLSGAFG